MLIEFLALLVSLLAVAVVGNIVQIYALAQCLRNQLRILDLQWEYMQGLRQMIEDRDDAQGDSDAHKLGQ